MSGSVFFAVIVGIIGVVCAFFVTPILLIPAILLIIGTVIFGTLGGGPAAAKTAGQEPSGVPSTAEATYDPVAAPEERRAV
jgi:hypothetical protein